VKKTWKSKTYKLQKENAKLKHDNLVLREAFDLLCHPAIKQMVSAIDRANALTWGVNKDAQEIHNDILNATNESAKALRKFI
jgi:hypothetical protein